MSFSFSHPLFPRRPLPLQPHEGKWNFPEYPRILTHDGSCLVLRSRFSGKNALFQFGTNIYCRPVNYDYPAFCYRPIFRTFVLGQDAGSPCLKYLRLKVTMQKGDSQKGWDWLRSVCIKEHTPPIKEYFTRAALILCTSLDIWSSHLVALNLIDAMWESEETSGRSKSHAVLCVSVSAGNYVVTMYQPLLVFGERGTAVRWLRDADCGFNRQYFWLRTAYPVGIIRFISIYEFLISVCICMSPILYLF